MNTMIKTIEDLSLNAWPSHQIQVYDGWLLRFSYFYTHRTNSVEQIGLSTLPIDDKIAYCEEVYKKWDTPCIFKISPLVDRIFDRELERRNYQIEHTTQVMVMDLETFCKPSPPNIEVTLKKTIPSDWIKGLFELKGTDNPKHRQIVPSMYRAIPKDTISASITADGQIVGTGLGIMDREYIGLYAIHVHPDYRGMGFARAICSSILSAGRKQGARKAYLQVVSGNHAAENLYRSLGFWPLYTYWFRVLH